MINSGINNTEKKFSGYEQTWLNTYAWSIFYIWEGRWLLRRLYPAQSKFMAR